MLNAVLNLSLWAALLFYLHAQWQYVKSLQVGHVVQRCITETLQKQNPALACEAVRRGRDEAVAYHETMKR